MYRTIDTALWSDPDVRKLKSAGKLLFLYLITNPHAHVGGIYYLPNVYILHDTGLPAESLNTVWHTLSEPGLARIDQNTDVVWVCNMLHYQGNGEKIYRSVANHLGTLHNTFLIKEFLQKYPKVKAFYKHRVSHRVSESGSSWHTGTGTGTGTGTVSPPTPPAGGTEQQIPSELDTPEFRTSWEEWLAYRRERRLSAYKSIGLKKLWAELAGWGVDRAVAAINHSIAKNWQGIHEANGKGGGSGFFEQTVNGLDEFVRRGEEVSHDS